MSAGIVTCMSARIGTCRRSHVIYRVYFFVSQMTKFSMSTSTESSMSLFERKTIALCINVALSFISWSRRHYILNKCIRPIHRHQMVSLAYTIFAGFLWWISTIAIDGNILLQLASGLIATIMSWYGLIIIVNERSGTVSSRQTISLFYYILTDVSVQIQARLILA